MMRNLIGLFPLVLLMLLGACTSMPSTQSNKVVLVTEEQRTLCSLINQPEKMEAVYLELLESKWDKDKVGCGAVYAYELVSQSTFSIESKLEAIGAQLVYFDVLSKLYPKLYKEGELGRELNSLWRATRLRTEKLIADVAFMDVFITEVTLLKGAYILANVEQDADTKTALSAYPKAMKEISKAVADKPEAVDGLGIYLLGRLKLSLPSFAGGDVDEAIVLFQRSLSMQPNSLEYLRWKLEAQAVLGNMELEKETVRQALIMKDENINDQDLVDLLLVFGGHAHRLDMTREIEKFRSNRNELLAEKPYLLSRKSSATLGHGGTDPITGIDPNAL